jgi:hypothetical protein
VMAKVARLFYITRTTSRGLLHPSNECPPPFLSMMSTFDR